MKCREFNAMGRVLMVVFVVMSAIGALACGSDEVDVPTVELRVEPTVASTPLPVNTPTSVIPTATEEVEVAVKERESELAERAAPTEAPIPTKVPAPTKAPPPTEEPVVEIAPERDLDIVTLLPFDAIRSIDRPNFFPDLETANMFYKDHELVLGVEIDGDARAYSVPLLSSHEIVNDVVGGEPIAVTW